MPAGKQGGGDFAVLLIDGYNLLAQKVKAFSWRQKLKQNQSDGLGDRWDEFTPTGRRIGTASQSGGFFDTSQNQTHAAFSAATNVSRLLVFAPAGNVIGAPFVGFSGAYQDDYAVLVSDGDLHKANPTYQVSGQVDEGVILQDHLTKSADWNTKTDGSPVDFTLDPSQKVTPITSNSIANPTVVTTPVPHGLSTGHIILISGVAGGTPTINGERTVTVISPTTFSIPVNASAGGTGGSFVRANSLNGGVGYQEISQMAGLTGFVGKIRDSADDVTYADLVTFGNVTAAPAAERATVAGIVDRFLSFDGNVTGTGTITPYVGFKRNE